MNTNTLVADIARYAKAYYQGTPLISDAEFDQLVEKLKVIDPENPILSTPGWGYVPEGVKYPHVTTVGSLCKIKIDTDSAKQFVLEKYNPSEWIYTPKLDGGSAVAYYSNGKLDRIISRGNGDEGVDITLNVLKGNSVPVELPKLFHEIKAVRGEVIISKSDFKEYLSQNYANARNASTGISQSIDSPNCKYLKFVVYDIIQSEDGVNDYQDQLTYLYDAGFIAVPQLRDIKTVDDFDKYSPANTDYDYDVDGIVACNNKVDIDENGISHYNAIAFKYEAESAIVRVTNVEWNESGHGKLIPVIEYEPVELSGAILTRCSGFNAKYIKDEGIGPGALIKICRSNEVIPHWMETISKVEPQLPDMSDKEWNGVHIIKVINDRESLVVANIINMNAVFGCGWGTLGKIVKKYAISSFDKLNSFIDNLNSDSLISDDIKNEVGQVYGEKVISTFKNIYTVPTTITDVLCCLQLDNFGWSTANNLENEFKTSSELCTHLMENHGSSGRVALCCPTYLAGISIKNYYELIVLILNQPFMWKTSSVQVSTNEVEAIKVAFTGKLSKPRGQLINDWSEFNIIEVDIKSAQYLITDNPNSGSSKNKMADKLGIKKVTETEFLNVIKGK